MTDPIQKLLPFRDRLRIFRAEKNLTQEELGVLLGVGKITILRWENGSSKPSPLAAQKLKQIGFGEIDVLETKRVSTPRLQTTGTASDLRAGINKTMKFGSVEFDFDPSPYVLNGPPDQLSFFQTMFDLQQHEQPPGGLADYVKRLSLVEAVPEIDGRPAQCALEKPKPTARHWNPNYGPHGWHRYVGRFPPHLVRALINHFGARRGDLICDPFAGSGTTLVESRLLGMRAIGIDLCPLSSLITRTKSRFPSDTLPLRQALGAFNNFYTNASRFLTVRPLAAQEILFRSSQIKPNGLRLRLFLECQLRSNMLLL